MSSSALKTFYDTIEPFTTRRSASIDDRIAMLTAWADVVERCVSQRYVFFNESPRSTTSNDDLMLSNTQSLLLSRSGRAQAPSADVLVMLVRYLRYTTLRKVVDSVMMDLDRPVLKRIIRAMLASAGEVSHILPTTDARIKGIRRGIPWGSLDEHMPSSDEDRDDGAPRPLDHVLLCTAELVVAFWGLLVQSSNGDRSSTTSPRRFEVSPTSADSSPTAASERTTRLHYARSNLSRHSSGSSLVAVDPHIALLLEDAKLVLLRLLKYRYQQTVGVALALTVLMMQLVSEGGEPVTDPSNNDVCVMLGELSSIQALYSAKADGGLIQRWAESQRGGSAVWSLYASLSHVANMYLGNSLSTMHPMGIAPLRCGSAARLAARSTSVDPMSFSTTPSHKAARRSTVEILLESLSWFLAHNGPTCSAMYLRSYPSRYGDESGYYRCVTETRIVEEALIVSMEVRSRCLILSDELQDRRLLVRELITGQALAFPYLPVIIPDRVPLEGPQALRYRSRQKISRMLDGMCPNRYPITDDMVLPEDLPEVDVMEEELERCATIRTELLRGVRLEVHHRLEIERLCAHELGTLQDAWDDVVRDMNRKQLAQLADMERQLRWYVEVEACEGAARAVYELEYESAVGGLCDVFLLGRTRARIRAKDRETSAITQAQYATTPVSNDVCGRYDVPLLAGPPWDQQAVIGILDDEDVTRRMLHAAERQHFEHLNALMLMEASHLSGARRILEHEAAARALDARWSLSVGVHLKMAQASSHPSTLVQQYASELLHPKIATWGATGSFSLGSVLDWYQRASDSVNKLEQHERRHRQRIEEDESPWESYVLTMVLPRLHYMHLDDTERRERNVLSVRCGLAHALLEEEHVRRQFVDEEHQCFQTLNTSWLPDLLLHYNQLSSRLHRAIEEETARRTLMEQEELSTRAKFASAMWKSRRSCWQYQRPSSVQSFGGERGIVPRQPRPKEITSVAPLSTSASIRSVEEPALMAAILTAKSPSRFSTPGLSGRTTSSLSAHDVSSATYVMDLDHMMGCTPRTPIPPAYASALWRPQHRDSPHHVHVLPHRVQVTADIPRRPMSARPLRTRVILSDPTAL